MDRLRELIEVLSRKKVQNRTYQAKQDSICKICKNPAISFETNLSEYEYKVSGICEDCQRYFQIKPDQ